MRFDRRKHGCRCQGCPLSGQPFVPSLGPNVATGRWMGIAELGESPGYNEEQQREPFVGKAGQELDRLNGHAGLLRKSLYFLNLIGCRPPGDKLDSEEGQEALERCRPGLEAEIQYLQTHGLKVLVPLGSNPLKALGVYGGITSRRGYVYDYKGTPVVGTFHPSWLVRGNFEERPTVVGDIRKARLLSENKLAFPKQQYLTHPTLVQFEAFAERVCAKKTLLGVDIETTSLIPEEGNIIVVGLAESGSKAISFPFLRSGGGEYWKPSEAPRAIKALQRVLAECPLVFHNATFDPAFLRSKSLPVGTIRHDTMLLHHCINAELPHSLRYVASVYACIPYWKDTLEDKEAATIRLENEALRTYNLTDAAVLLQVLEPMLKDAKVLQVLDLYEKIAVPLIEPILEMTKQGMGFSRDRQQVWERGLEKKLRTLVKTLKKTFSLPEAFNLGSADHLRYLLFGQAPEQLLRAKRDYEARSAELIVLRQEHRVLTDKVEILTKKEAARLVTLASQIGRKETSKVYKECQARSQLLVQVKPLILPTGLALRKTQKTKALQLDDEALLSLKIGINNRLTVIQGMIRPLKTAAAEQTGLEHTLDFLETLQEYRETAKLLSTYGDFKVWKDGRVHFPFKMTGTATGRLSSGSKRDLGVGNGQNIPKEARKLFTAEEGWLLLGADYNSLEPRVLAYAAEDEPAIQDFESGIKIYDAIIKETLGLTKSYPYYADLRQAIKIYVLGTNYGGSVETVYRQMALKVAKLPLTLKQLKDLHRKRRELHPGYSSWYDRTVASVQRTRQMRNAFGRLRIFHGDATSIVREALDFAAQSTAADIINQATIRLYRDMKKRGLKTRMVLQLHDALYLEAPRKEAKLAARLLKKHMETPITVGKYQNVVFPVEVSQGPSWGEMEEVSL